MANLNRLEKLGTLLESKNRLLREEAVALLAKMPIVVAGDSSNNNLFDILQKFLNSPVWEARTSAADAIGRALANNLLMDIKEDENFAQESTSSCCCSTFYEELKQEEDYQDGVKMSHSLEFEHINTLEGLDIAKIIELYRPLLSCDSLEVVVDSSKSESILTQRKLIDQHLDMSMQAAGVSSRAFILDEEIKNSEILPKPSTTSISTLKFLNKKDLKMELEKLKNLNISCKNCQQQNLAKNNEVVEKTTRIFVKLIGDLMANLIDPIWQTRHGSALAFVKILSNVGHRIQTCTMKLIVVRLLEMLALDRFNDFVSGNSATSPICEAGAQAISIILLRFGEKFPLICGRIFQQIQQLFELNAENQWQSRQTALIILKYYFSACQLTPNFHGLFENALLAMRDEVDEVMSKSVICLSSILKNPNFNGASKRPLVARLMSNVWCILENGEMQSQLMEGVDSLLIDLLNIIEIWLKIDENSKLNSTQFFLIINLLNPQFVSQSVNVMSCLMAALDRFAEIESELIYRLIKAIFRCLLFVESGDTKLIKKIFELQEKIQKTIPDVKLKMVTDLHMSIGLWMSCLACEHKNPEIDVFNFRLDGITSKPASPLEMICGEDLRFVEERERNERLITRKVLAARFLAWIFDLSYRSGIILGNQPLFVAIQLLFSPNFKSAMLYQRFGNALMASCFARIYRFSTFRATEQQYQIPYPSCLAKEIEEAIYTPIKGYDEFTTAIAVLTKECDEFSQYCIRKGVPSTDLPVIGAQVSIEDSMRIAYEKCLLILKKPEDRETLMARFSYIRDLIDNTKLNMKTNTNRVIALLCSALFSLGNLPTTLTPMIRPLMDALEYETNSAMIEEIFSNSFALMLAATLNKLPCPHAKILKQISAGLCSCDIYAPKIQNWSDPKDSLTILSTDENFQVKLLNIGTKSKNCGIVIGQICQHFMQNLFTMCPEFKNIISLDVEDLEEYLMHLEVLRIVYIRQLHCLPELQILVDIGENAAKFAENLSHCSPAVRYRTARFLGTLANENMAEFLNRFYDSLYDMLANIGADSARCGAVELLAQFERMEPQKIIGIISLLAPLALRASTDPIPTIRNTASLVFGKFVALLTLQNSEKFQPPNLNANLMSKYEKSLDFLNVLSCPNKLPRLNSNDIPGLVEQDDIKLRDYQLEGITWLQFLNRFGLHGILADEMGLGKTLQILCLLALELKEEGANTASNIKNYPSLIICPRTLVDHWCNEWQNYFPRQHPFFKFETSNCHFDLAAISKTQTQAIFVISYEELRSAKKISEISWNYVILDEGHCIRNSNTQIFKMAISLKAKNRLILSGTPVQNSPADLWALFTFLMPGYLFSKADFHGKFMKQIMACRNPKATEQQTIKGEEALQNLHARVLPFIMRRVKSDVLRELPEKVIQDYSCSLTQLQRQIYEKIVDSCTAQNNSNKNGGVGKEALLNPLQALILLRKVVDHPILVAETMKDLNTDLFNGISTNYELSGKMVALKELLEECQISRGETANPEKCGIENGDLEEQGSIEQLLINNNSILPQRALIFCQWRASIDLIAGYLDQGVFGHGISYSRLDGQVPPNERQMVVDRFNRDSTIDLMLLSTHIGGVGLTLTGANVVIFVDHDWNPIKDLQAIDRAHRLGQTRTVNVYRLITKESIEEKVMRYQKFKTDTANVLVGADNRSLAVMSSGELKDLLSLGSSSSNSNNNNNSKNNEQIDEQIASKRRKINHESSSNEADLEAKYSLKELWDESQYVEQHDVQAFIQTAGL